MDANRIGDDSGGAASAIADQLANAIVALAGARHRIPIQDLLRETSLNIQILSRIASNRLDDRQRREDIEAATDALITQLRHAIWELPASTDANLETPPP